MFWSLWLLVAQAADGPQFLPHTTTLFDRLASFVGLLVMVGLCYAASENRKAVNWRPVLWGVGLQLLFGLIVLSPAISDLFYTVVDGGVRKLLSFSEAGATFVFQSVHPHKILDPDGNPVFYVGTLTGVSPPVKTFAFWILPTIIFFSSLMSVLYYLGVMQVVVKALAWVMVRTLGTSGAESLVAAGNIFIGQTEAPLLVRPFVDGMTRSELMVVMTAGFATVAGGVMGAYVQFLQGIPNIAGHLVIASVLSAPAAIVCAKLVVPETEESQTRGTVKVDLEKNGTNLIEAAANGASDGMKLAINVAAMLIAMVALVAMFDWSISFVPVSFCGGAATVGYSCAAGVAHEPLSLTMILGWLFTPMALLMGVPWSESRVVGELLGEKLVLTEFLAYVHLGELVNGDVPVMSQRTAVICSYALCGFANFASIGIQLGGIGGIAPRRMPDLAELGFKAMLAGAMACCMTGAVAGILL